MNPESTSFETLIFRENCLEILDQTLLPSEIRYLEIPDVESAVLAIKEMRCRGAPLIAVVALYSLVYDSRKNQALLSTPAQFTEFIEKNVQKLKESRPTAVNLSNDLGELLHKLQESPSKTWQTVKSFADANFHAYEKACADLSRHGADFIQQKMQQNNKKMLHVLTICNTGKLATPGIGTALGIVRELHRRNVLKRLYIPETRPYNQGSRLTASEAVMEHLPATLITDSMAAVLMKEGKVDCVIVGADRVVGNGTTANKIGTYSLAVLAHYHKIPFYVACPDSTIDRTKLVGSEIVIEERPAEELKKIHGKAIAPNDIDCWNPAFDLTYPHLIEKIITENGEFVFRPVIGDWEQVSKERLDYILKHKLRLFDKHEELTITDVADGNLNLVYCVRGKTQAFCVKQALPYVKCVGSQWELTLQRALFEAEALKYQSLVCEGQVPVFFAFIESLALLVMEFLDAPHIILRKGLLKHEKYKDIGAKIGSFIARTCFFSSGLVLKADEFREKTRFWAQNSLCALTEQVVFLDPYMTAPLNRWTSPQLDAKVQEIQGNNALVVEVLQLRSKFLSLRQALIHADLHTGSVMVTPQGSVKVIDAEFAFYGPIGFDTGAFLANLLLNFFAQRGHAKKNKEICQEYRDWLLGEIKEFYTSFEENWLKLWNTEENRTGDDFPQKLVGKHPEILRKSQENFLREVFEDTLGFAGCKMIRRIVGVAHVEDLESIENKDLRAVCEGKALEMAECLILKRKTIKNIEEIAEIARKIDNS